MPIPIPIQVHALGVGAPTLGAVVVVGLADAAVGADTIEVTNRSTGRSWSGPVNAGGSLSVVVEAEAGHRLDLRTRIGSVLGDPVELVVPAASLPPPSVGVVRQTGALLTASGLVDLGTEVVLSLPRTGTTAATSSVGQTFTFHLPFDATTGDTVYLFARAATGVSTHVTAMVNPKVQTVCIDDDIDGYGAAGTSLGQCSASTTLPDCNNTNAAVHPGQQQYFSASIPGASPGTEHDYDCNNVEEPQYTGLAACSASKTCDAHGWQGTPPACGQIGVWIQCVQQTQVCAEQTQTRTQACR